MYNLTPKTQWLLNDLLGIGWTGNKNKCIGAPSKIELIILLPQLLQKLKWLNNSDFRAKNTSSLDPVRLPCIFKLSLFMNFNDHWAECWFHDLKLEQLPLTKIYRCHCVREVLIYVKWYIFWKFLITSLYVMTALQELSMD